MNHNSPYDQVGATLIYSTCNREPHRSFRSNLNTSTTLYTDEHRAYTGLKDFNHESLSYSFEEHVRIQVLTNGIKSFWSLLKNGYIGIFHRFTGKHLYRYLVELGTYRNIVGNEGALRLDAILEAASGCRFIYQELIS